jgi:hypothetical protein
MMVLDQQAGLDRRKSQADLVEQGKQERNSANAQPGQKTAAHRCPKRANAKQRQPEQRIFIIGGVQSISAQARDGSSQHPNNGCRIYGMLAKNFQYVRQQPDAAAE